MQLPARVHAYQAVPHVSVDGHLKLLARKYQVADTTFEFRLSAAKLFLTNVHSYGFVKADQVASVLHGNYVKAEDAARFVHKEPRFTYGVPIAEYEQQSSPSEYRDAATTRGVDSDALFQLLDRN